MINQNQFSFSTLKGTPDWRTDNIGLCKKKKKKSSTKIHHAEIFSIDFNVLFITTLSTIVLCGRR